MKKNYFLRKLFAVGTTLMMAVGLQAQQLPDPSFEDWSGAAFDGKIQPKYWHFSNVEQLGIKFNLAHQEKGRTGNYAMMVQCTEVGAMGITEAAPGYISMGQPWQCLPSITEIKKATAGTSGGIQFAYRPDSMQVWVKRTGPGTSDEDFHLLYYAWSGTSQGASYKGKDGSCTAYSATNEESDIRQALDKNECQTTQMANQIAEGWHRERASYNDWTCITVPIYYFNDNVPEMCNVIFSASNYPNFRANGGLVVGNSLYVDDVKMLYASTIQKLFIGNKEWKGFDPNSTEEQVYSLGNTTAIPAIYAMRGAGTLTNAHGGSATFTGRKLTASEMTIQQGEIDGAPTIITVTAADGSSTHTYKIKFISKPSNNARLASITVNGEPISGYNGFVSTYNVALPYGTTATPVVDVVKAEEGQVVNVTQATSVMGTSTIHVTAPDGTTKMTYTLKFSVAPLADNTLKDILVNGESVANFRPATATYKVELPLGTTTMPTVEAVSAYKKGEQIIQYTAPSVIDGGQYQIAVSTAGAPTPKVYKLNFKITASTNTLLKDLQVEGYDISFLPTTSTYYVELPMGTTELPNITYVTGDKWQTVTIEKGGVDDAARIIVKAASGDEKVYKIVFSTLKSEVNWLNGIALDGTPLEGFDKDIFEYNYVLPIGTTQLPTITWTAGDEFQKVSVMLPNTLEGTARITVTPQTGSIQLYKINFSVLKANNATLQMLFVDGKEIENFSPSTLEYTVALPQGTTAIPQVTWTAHDEWQTITVRQATSLTGEAQVTVRPQEGTAQTYKVRFSVNTSSNTDLKMISIGGQPIPDFSADSLDYTFTLPTGVSAIPEITYEKAETVQKVFVLTEGEVTTLRVTAENGATRTYTLTFIVQKSENAFLKMIYLNEKPLDGFAPDKLSGYTVELIEGVCPVITVDKEAGQSISIITPASAGVARITVQPESGAANVYEIKFTLSVSPDVQLKDILIGGTSLSGFKPNVYAYEVPFDGTLPAVTFTKGVSAQKVVLLQDKFTTTLLVQNGDKEQLYTLNFVRQLSADATLKGIALNGKALTNFAADKFTYDIVLAAGETLPTVTYTKNIAEQTVVAGQISEDEYAITVTAENTISNTYTLHFTNVLYADATLADIRLDGTTITGFVPAKLTYTIHWTKDVPLPNLTYTKRAGQHVLQTQTSDTQQEIVVVAENGTQNTYVITYEVTLSNNALLKDILVDGKSLEGFAADKKNYVDSLAWRTKVVPVINPIAGAEGQTITINYSAINNITAIHVVAADGKTTADYTIAFPVYKSNNTLLENVEIDGVSAFIFNPEQELYDSIVLPYGLKKAPQMIYTSSEPEQTIDFIDAPIGDTTKIVVTAENGYVRTYRFVYVPTYSDKANRFSSILINGNPISLKGLKEVDAEHLELTVDMPYGTTEFNVACVENYAEQTYLLQPGGTKRPTIITLYPNRGDEKAVTYTIIPNISQQNPAHLTSISVNGTPIEGFEIDRLEYIVNLTSDVMPNFAYVVADGATVKSAVQKDRSWSIQVNSGGYAQTYKVVFHYPNDVIPNADFTEWTKASVRTSADKPTYWQVAADYADTHLGTAKTGKEITKGDDGIVKLSTEYHMALASGIPSIITLGSLNFSFAVAGGTSSQFYGGIPFKNSPDSVAFSYYHKTKKGNGMLFAFRFNDGITEHKFDYVTAEENTEFITYTHPLGTSKLGKVTQMNIAVNATGETKGASTGAEAYVDWFRFIYNSKLDSLFLDDEEVKLLGTEFKYSFDDPDADTKPALRFVGQVSDQARKVEWGVEKHQGDSAVREAIITNYAEDGTSTVYTLTVSRPLSKVNTLAGIQVGNQSILKKDVFDYTISLSATDKMPNVVLSAATNLQDVKMVQNGEDKLIITVTPEAGEVQVYTITFQRTKSNDTTLQWLEVEGITYDAAMPNYTLAVTQMPAITFEKKEDAQRVELIHLDKQAIIKVTAEDGTEGAYTITLNPEPQVTSGLLTKLVVDGNELKGFEMNTFEYTAVQPQTTAFVREFDTDSLVQVIAPSGITWNVLGTTQHTYSLKYPTNLSANANLLNIQLNGDTLPNFLPIESNYTIATDTMVDILLEGEKGQKQVVKYENGIFSIQVTAANDTERTEAYTITMEEELSSLSTLKMIYLDGKPLAAFKADSLAYYVELPCGNPKTEEPQLPTITYALGQSQQQVELTLAPLGGTSYILVTSEDGKEHSQYALTIVAEPSHNAMLNNILINGTPVKGFTPERYWYSMQTQNDAITLHYSSDDLFQQVVEKRGADGEYILEVTAQDGTTVNNYYIELWAQTQSNNAYLKNILLNGKTFSEYDSNSDDFTPKQLRYNINVPASATVLPDMYVSLQEAGQTWKTYSGKDTDTIRVTAPDGITTNDYILNYIRVKSSNADLSMVYVAGEPLATFSPEKTSYMINLPVGTTNLPTVDVVKGDNTQTYNLVQEDNTIFYIMTAEDGTQKTYLFAFNFLLSEADTLAMIYEDAVPMADFVSTTFYYNHLLPIGARTAPVVTYEQADQWQTVKVDTITNATNITYQFNVLAQSGKKNVYTLVYEIQTSAVDTLQMIWLDNQALANFDANTTNYTFELQEGSDSPNITWQTGDAYQTVQMTNDDQRAIILVTAENGQQRTYTITFFRALSDNANLKMLTVAGENVPNFDAEVLTYNIALTYGTTSIPAITFVKEEEEQNVTIVVEGWTARVEVLAADQQTTQTYELHFTVNRSDNAWLQAILLDGKLLEIFDPQVTEYDVILPLGTELLPKVTYRTSDEQQTVEMTQDNQIVILTVTSGNGDEVTEYVIRFDYELSPVNTLSDLQINGSTIEGFASGINEYYIIFPNGTTEDQLYTIDDVTYTLTDTTAMAVVTEQDAYTITILVTAANGEANAYIIHQEISLPNNALLADIQLNGVTVEGFNPEEFEYEYLLLEGAIMPIITATAQDSTAEVAITMGNVGDTTYVYCTAQDGTEYVYTVYVHYSDLNTVAEATAQDVILKHISGTNQYFAATTRQGVQIAFFNLQGQKVQYHKVPICDPNAVNVTIDSKGNELLADVDVTSDGAIITIEDYNTPLVYLFLQNDTTPIASGKIVLMR